MTIQIDVKPFFPDSKRERGDVTKKKLTSCRRKRRCRRELVDARANGISKEGRSGEAPGRKEKKDLPTAIRKGGDFHLCTCHVTSLPQRGRYKIKEGPQKGKDVERKNGRKKNLSI